MDRQLMFLLQHCKRGWTHGSLPKSLRRTYTKNIALLYQPGQLALTRSPMP